MTDAEKAIIRAALMRYEDSIKEDLTQQEHTADEVQQAFDVWNSVTKLIVKYSK